MHTPITDHNQALPQFDRELGQVRLLGQSKALHYVKEGFGRSRLHITKKLKIPK